MKKYSLKQTFIHLFESKFIAISDTTGMGGQVLIASWFLDRYKTVCWAYVVRSGSNFPDVLLYDKNDKLMAVVEVKDASAMANITFTSEKDIAAGVAEKSQGWLEMTKGGMQTCKNTLSVVPGVVQPGLKKAYIAAGHDLTELTPKELADITSKKMKDKVRKKAEEEALGLKARDVLQDRIGAAGAKLKEKDEKGKFKYAYMGIVIYGHTLADDWDNSLTITKKMIIDPDVKTKDGLANHLWKNGSFLTGCGALTRNRRGTKVEGKEREQQYPVAALLVLLTGAGKIQVKYIDGPETTQEAEFGEVEYTDDEGVEQPDLYVGKYKGHFPKARPGSASQGKRSTKGGYGTYSSGHVDFNKALHADILSAGDHYYAVVKGERFVIGHIQKAKNIFPDIPDLIFDDTASPGQLIPDRNIFRENLKFGITGGLPLQKIPSAINDYVYVYATKEQAGLEGSHKGIGDRPFEKKDGKDIQKPSRCLVTEVLIRRWDKLAGLL